MPEKLKPCPFCGEILHAEWNEKKNYLAMFHKTMFCDCPLHLGVFVFAKNKAEAVEKWNRRASDGK